MKQEKTVFTQQTGRGIRKALNKRCIICTAQITSRSLKGKAQTCDQKCAGKLAWKSRDK